VSLPLSPPASVDGWVRTGPIPKGTSINLLANLEPDFKQLVVLKVKITKALAEIHALNEPLAGSRHSRSQPTKPQNAD
jgi:hypothetical protein